MPASACRLALADDALLCEVVCLRSLSLIAFCLRLVEIAPIPVCAHMLTTCLHCLTALLLSISTTPRARAHLSHERPPGSTPGRWLTIAVQISPPLRFITRPLQQRWWRAGTQARMPQARTTFNRHAARTTAAASASEARLTVQRERRGCVGVPAVSRVSVGHQTLSAMCSMCGVPDECVCMAGSPPRLILVRMSSQNHWGVG